MSRQHHRARARALGHELERLRRRACMSSQQVGQLLGWSAPTMSRIENGGRDTAPEEIAALLAVYKITGTENRRLMCLARTLDQPGWLETSLDGLSVQLTALRAFEAKAKTITEVGTLVIPELVQTPDYARARLESGGLPPESIDHLTAIHLQRQAIMTRRTAPAVQVVLDEAALTRPIGGHAVMAGQVRHLIQMAALPNVTVRVIQEAGHPGLDGSYATLEFRAPAQPLVHLNRPRSAVFVDEPADVRSFLAATADLVSKALSPPHSLGLLASIAYRHVHLAENMAASQVSTGRSPGCSRTC